MACSVSWALFLDGDHRLQGTYQWKPEQSWEIQWNTPSLLSPSSGALDELLLSSAPEPHSLLPTPDNSVPGRVSASGHFLSLLSYKKLRLVYQDDMLYVEKWWFVLSKHKIKGLSRHFHCPYSSTTHFLFLSSFNQLFAQFIICDFSPCSK